jgi:hypothetical protein
MPQHVGELCDFYSILHWPALLKPWWTTDSKRASSSEECDRHYDRHETPARHAFYSHVRVSTIDSLGTRRRAPRRCTRSARSLQALDKPLVGVNWTNSISAVHSFIDVMQMLYRCYTDALHDTLLISL